MPSPYVARLAKETGKPEKEIESLWDKAKGIASDTLGVPEKSFSGKEYAYTTGIVKNMLGIKEDVLNPSKFLESDYSAKEYIETITSSAFPSLIKNDIIPPDEEDDKEDLSNHTESLDVSDEEWGEALDKMFGEKDQ